MTPKRQYTVFIILLCLLGGISSGLMLAGCSRGPANSAQTDQEQLYTCSMHPQVIQKKPGNCPICGMKLIPIRRQLQGTPPVDQHKHAAMGASPQAPQKESGVIEVDPVTVQNMDVRTGLVARGPLRRVIRTVGIVDFDESTLTDVTTKFRGWIVKLYVDTTGQQAHRGEPLFDIYSPELYSAQVEYLLALKQSTNSLAGAETLKSSALAKLQYFDIPDEQIAEIEKSGKPKKALRIDAPHDGIVVEKMAVEGQMVEPAMKLYRLADLGTVWIQAQVYEQDLPMVRLGQEATVTLPYMQDRKFRGRVTYIYPVMDETTRTAKVRMEFHNPGYFLKPGMFATIDLVAELSPSALLVPDMAVLRSGEKNTVFVALEGGKFEPRTVTLGARAEGGMFEVLSGLAEGEKVVVSGQFMLDSESQLREAILKMTQPNQVAAAEQQHTNTPTAAPATTSAGAATAEASEMVYICPMPEHVSVEYDHPGKCPLCGMTLVPVSRDTLAKVQPGGTVEYYTCPMPEHSDVREKKPGKCPRCRMTLIPVMEQKKPAAATNAATQAAEELPKLYTCPMARDADVVMDHPGECPKCGMRLVETSKVAHGKVAEENWRKQHPQSQH